MPDLCLSNRGLWPILLMSYDAAGLNRLGSIFWESRPDRVSGARDAAEVRNGSKPVNLEASQCFPVCPVGWPQCAHALLWGGVILENILVTPGPRRAIS